MTQGVQNLISAIDSGDATAIDAAFNAEMATRISSRLEDMRVSVAQNMFATEQSTETEETEAETTETEENPEVELTPEDETALNQQVEAEVEGA
jgi:hypothetical protein